jgi:lipopolysaccharide export system permease protein
MRLHDRYFFRELLTPLAYCLGGFMAVWVSFFFFTKLDEMREAKLHALDVIEYCLASLPEFFLLVLPVLLLLALLYALTHHARHNEITALRAAGVSLWRLCAPYFIVGLLASGVYLALNEMAVPRCQAWTKEILTRHVKNQEDSKVKTRFTGVNFDHQSARRHWHIVEYDTKTCVAISPDVRWWLADDAARRIIAERGTFTNGTWVFFNAQVLQLKSVQENWRAQFSTNELTMPEFDETPAQIALDIKFSDAGGLMSSRSAGVPLVDLWPYLRNHPELASKDRANWWTKFHARIAAPWTCLVVVLMAIPFGAQSGRRNLFFGVAGSIFICFAYFVLQAVCFALGMSGILPSWLAAWLPNIFFSTAGIILTLRSR